MKMNSNKLLIFLKLLVYRIKMDTSGARVNTEDLKTEKLRLLILDATKQIENENKMIALGKIFFLKLLILIKIFKHKH
jgi:hypothetical protein